MIDSIRKAIERVTERLQEYADSLSDFTSDKRLVGQPVPVRVSQPYSVSKKSTAVR